MLMGMNDVAGSVAIKVTVENIELHKTFTITKQIQGGSGSDGDSGYTVILTNESHIILCDDKGNPL